MSIYLQLFFWVLPLMGMLSIAAYFSYHGVPTQTILLEYQRGILYKRGKPVRDVGPGRYWVWSGTELIVHADTRPMSISFQNQAVSLQDGSTGAYSFSARVQVHDIRKVIYAAQNYQHVPPTIFLGCCRLTLNRQTGSQLRTNRESVLEEIARTARTRLTAAGFEMLEFRITELLVVEPNTKAESLQSTSKTKTVC